MEGEEQHTGGDFDNLFDDLDRFFAEDPGDTPSGPPPSSGRLPADPREPPASSDERPDPSRVAGPPPSVGEPTGELSTSDWRRLQDVLGEGEGDEVEYQSGSLEETEEGDERDEVELLALAPPGEGGSGAPPPSPLPTAPRIPAAEAASFGSASADADPNLSGDTPLAPEQRGPSSDEPLWDERAISEVEATADQLSKEFGYRPVEEHEDPLIERAPQPSRPTGPRTIKVTEPEEMAGAGWGSPAPGPRTPKPATSPSGPSRDLPAAVLTAVVLAILGLILIAVSRAAFAVLASAVVLFAQTELYRTMHRRGYQPATALGLVMGALVLAGAYWRGEPAMLLFVAMSVPLSFFWFMLAPPKAREGSLANIGATLLGLLYVPFLASYILVILSQTAAGRALLLSVLGLTFLYDVAAFAVGSGWGRRPLAPTISPKKSWEGLAGATLITLIAAVAILPAAVGPFNVTRAIGLFLVVVIFAPLGDLAESAIKRDLGVKDMGTMLPGHGGMLDRIDSVLLVAPAAWYFFHVFF